MKLHLSELYYNLGHILHQQNDLAGAVAAYQQAICLNSAFAQAHHSLAVVLSEQGRYEAAIQHYKQVTALQPDAVKAYNNIGCILVQQGKWHEALLVYHQAISLKPDWAVLYCNLGRAVESNDPVAAVAAYRQASDLQPDLITAHYNLGQALQKQEQHQAAIAAFERVLAMDASDAAAHTGCGLSYLALGHWQQALYHFQQALLPQQSYIAAFCDWADQLPEADPDELVLARKACSQFLQALLQPQSSLPTLKLGRASLILADRSSTNQYADWQQLLSQTYWHLGNLLMRYGGDNQYRQAEHYYQQALQLQPRDIELSLQLIECLVKQKRWNAALLVSHWALMLSPERAVYQKLGNLLEQQQRWQEAIFYYCQALKSKQRRSLSTASISVDSSFELNSLNRQSSPIESVQGIYKLTLDWINHVQSHSYISLEPDADHQLIRKPTDFSQSLSSASSLSCCIKNSSNIHSECGGLNCQRCLQEIESQFQLVHLGQRVYTCEARTLHVQLPSYFVAEVMQGYTWISPYVNAWMVTNATAVFTPDRYLLADVSREYPGQLPTCSQPYSSFDRVLQPKAFSEAEHIRGRVAVLAGLSGHNYFHWMVDVLPRIELLQRGGVDLTDVDWFWLNQPQSQFQRETLQILGIPSTKVLASDRHPHIQADLIVPAFPGHLGWIEPWVLAFLRQTFLPIAAAMVPRQPLHQRIYISRNKAHHRRLLNEAAVLDCLKPLGFVAVELESLSFFEQIALFAHAEVIIAPHGGGLTNTLFCQPGTCVVELFAPHYIRHYYWVISHQLGLRHWFIKGKEFICSPVHRLMYPSPLMDDIWLDLDALQAALRQIGLK
ncbi:MAG: DUF563 domain-containing protein [Elainella sp. C42_A2020_010]|nr:DUF563 domain-containing protein [Elainella sp. C42_A2020_010]